MRLTIALVASLSTGCLGYVVGEKQPPAPVVQPDTINLNRKISFAVDSCISVPYAAELEVAASNFASYGVTLTFDSDAKLKMDCNVTGDPKGDTGVARFGDRIDFRLADLQQLDPWGVEHAIMHEVGHMLGAMHVASTNSIMYPVLTGTLQLTDDDVESIEEQENPEREVQL
jgi:Matrixin